MKTAHALAALSFLVASGAAAQAVTHDPHDVLLVDFVEMGRMDRSLPRDSSMVDLVNLTQQVLDVKVGDGAATLQPKERIIARVSSGDVAVDVTSHDEGVAPMGGKLHLESGVRYELALGYGAAPAPEMSQPGVDSDASAPATAAAPAGAAPGSPDIAPKPADAAGAAPRKAPKATPRGKGGKVDIGRRPRR